MMCARKQSRSMRSLNDEAFFHSSPQLPFVSSVARCLPPVTAVRPPPRRALNWSPGEGGRGAAARASARRSALRERRRRRVNLTFSKGAKVCLHILPPFRPSISKSGARVSARPKRRRPPSSSSASAQMARRDSVQTATAKEAIANRKSAENVVLSL